MNLPNVVANTKFIVLLVLLLKVCAVYGQMKNVAIPDIHNSDVCSRKAHGRGAGTVLAVQCNPTEDRWGGLCYPKCDSGYESVGCCLCRKQGCVYDQFTQSSDGASCIKPRPYGRGAGYSWFFSDGLNDRGMYRRCESNNGQGNCEKKGLIVYPKCRKGFHAFGCCICSPTCPSEYYDIGAFCIKPVKGRGVGVSRLGCPLKKERDAGLCYNPCPSGYTGIGPVCWQRCPPNKPHNCGLFCTSSKAKCISTTVTIVGISTVLGASVAAGGIGIAGATSVLGKASGIVTIIKGIGTAGVASGIQYTYLSRC